MVNGSSIQIRLTKQQKDRAILAMQNAGYKTMSNYVRSLILGQGLTEEKMIKKIYEKVVLGENHES